MSDPEPTTADERLRVLLVEDTLDEALLIRSILEEDAGCKVTLAQDGIRGCQLAGNQEWDLVVTDLNIPGRDGMEVIRSTKQASPETPVLATTAYTRADYVEQALRSGADDIVQKPLERDDFMKRVRSLTRARREEIKEEREAGGDGGAERTILAVGPLPGDVEVGCGGILLGHRSHGHRVVIVVTCAGGDEEDMEDRKAEAERSAKLLGAKLVLSDPFRGAIPPLDQLLATMKEAVARFEPDTLYTPAPDDVRESRLNTYQAAVVEGSEVTNHYCYQAATTTLDFHPTLFIDVAEHMERKLTLLEEYRSQPDFRPHLQPYLARASAQYWGRFLGYGEVEPLEVVRSEI